MCRIRKFSAQLFSGKGNINTVLREIVSTGRKPSESGSVFGSQKIMEVALNFHFLDCLRALALLELRFGARKETLARWCEIDTC